MGGYQTRDYSGNYYGLCQCASCRALFRERTKLELPKTEDMSDPTYRKYPVFRRETSREHKHAVDRFIHELRPDICVDKAWELGTGYIRQESNTAVDRALPHWQYSGSENTKWALSSYPSMIYSNTTVDFVDIPYRHVGVSPTQQKLRLVQNLANRGALDYYLIGRLDNHEDRSGYAGIKEIFHYHAAHEEDYKDLELRATIALLKGGAEENLAEYRGWYRFLSEHHYLFHTPVVEAARDISLDGYRAIVLPDLKYVDDVLAARLDSFAEAGGTVIAIGQSAFYDGGFEHRAAPALRCLGIEHVEQVRHDMRPSYFRLSPEDKGTFRRFADTDLVFFEPTYVYARYRDKSRAVLRLVPPHHFGPPERRRVSR